MRSCQDKTGNGLLLVVLRRLERVGRADVLARPSDARFEPIEDARLAGVARDQVEGVNAARLTDAIDATDTLLEAHRIPRQLEIDDDSARLVKVQALAGGVGGQKNGPASTLKIV